MERTYIFANGLPYMSRYYLFLCLTSDCNNLHTVKAKFRGQPDFFVEINPANCKATFFIQQSGGTGFYHHMNIKFYPGKKCFVFDVKKFIADIGLQSKIDFSHFSQLSASSNWIDTNYGILTIEEKPPCAKHIFLAKNFLMLCGKAVYRIFYEGPTSQNENLPKEIVSAPHAWTINDIDTIVQYIPQDGLRSFEVYVYGSDIVYTLNFDEKEIAVIAKSGVESCKYISHDVTKTRIAKGFEVLFEFISAVDMAGIKRKRDKLNLFTS